MTRRTRHRVYNESMTTATETITLNITVKNETREVEFIALASGRFISLPVFGARFQTGTKVHRIGAMAVEFPTVADARKMGYSRKNVIEADGKVYGFQDYGMVHNRPVSIFCFADAAEGTVAESKWTR